MKSEIFSMAISNRNKIKFLYGMKEIMLDPYFILRESTGKKVIYGRAFNSSEIKKFEYERISNIKVLRHLKFTPIIPIVVN
ncbi:MAG: hypothetical protein ACYCVH_07560 [Ignavibacteriaceae bacterium]